MAPKKTKPANREVGFKRPPKSGRFKPGKSGNPRGRPKKTPSFLEVVSLEANRPVSVQVGGKVQKMTKTEVLVRKAFQLAMDGNIAFLRMLTPLLLQSSLQDDLMEEAGPDALIDAGTMEIAIERMLERRRRT